MESKIESGWHYDDYNSTVEDDTEEEHDDEDERLKEDYGCNVAVKVGQCTFTVSIGEGKQTARWLGLVASTRYSAFVQANGKQRQREDSLLEAGNFVPNWVKFNNKVIDPNKSLSAVLFSKKNKSTESKSDGLPLFEVDLCKEVSLGDDGAPVLRDWQAKAFCHSDAGKEHVNEQIAKLGERGNQHEEDEDDDSETEAKKYSAPGFNSFFAGPSAIAAEVESDWEKIKQFPHFENWFHTLEYNKLDTEKEKEIRSAILNSMESLCSLIDHFSWQWRRPSSFMLSVFECRHFLHHTKVISFPQDEERVASTIDFVLSNSKGTQKVKTPSFKSYLMQRHQFILIILSLANSNVKPQAFATEVVRIFSELINPAGQSLSVMDKGVVIRRVLGKSSIAALFRSKKRADKEKAEILQKVFKKFCVQSTSKVTEPALTLRELNFFLTECIPAQKPASRGESKSHDFEVENGEGKHSEQEGKSSTSVSRLKRARDIFVKAQVLDPSNPAVALEELVFAEFIYSILVALYEREEHADTWDSKHGSRQFLDLLEEFSCMEFDEDEE